MVVQIKLYSYIPEWTWRPANRETRGPGS